MHNPYGFHGFFHVVYAENVSTFQQTDGIEHRSTCLLYTSTKSLGGIPSLTAAVVVCVGLLGGILGFKTMKLTHIGSPMEMCIRDRLPPMKPLRLKNMIAGCLLAAGAVPVWGQSGAPTLVIRIDDLGALHSVNAACIQTYRSGIARSVEVMPVAAWYPERCV